MSDLQDGTINRAIVHVIEDRQAGRFPELFFGFSDGSRLQLAVADSKWLIGPTPGHPPDPVAPRQIRSTHRYSFRPGEWATLLAEGDVQSGWRHRLVRCYAVQFPDGTLDWWPVENPGEPYEIRAAP